MSFLDVAVCITSFYDSNKAILSQVDILKANFFDRMLCIFDKCVSNVNACLEFETFVFGKNQFCYINCTFSL